LFPWVPSCGCGVLLGLECGAAGVYARARALDLFRLTLPTGTQRVHSLRRRAQ